MVSLLLQFFSILVCSALILKLFMYLWNACAYSFEEIFSDNKCCLGGCIVEETSISKCYSNVSR